LLRTSANTIPETAKQILQRWNCNTAHSTDPAAKLLFFSVQNKVFIPHYKEPPIATGFQKISTRLFNTITHGVVFYLKNLVSPPQS
jgi:hypothetical protein